MQNALLFMYAALFAIGKILFLVSCRIFGVKIVEERVGIPAPNVERENCHLSFFIGLYADFPGFCRDFNNLAVSRIDFDFGF